TSAAVPSTLKLPPVLVPPPPAMTFRSTATIASGVTSWGVAVTAGWIINFTLAGALLSTTRCSIRCSAVTATANTTAEPINRSSLFRSDESFISVGSRSELLFPETTRIRFAETVGPVSARTAARAVQLALQLFDFLLLLFDGIEHRPQNRVVIDLQIAAG